MKYPCKQNPYRAKRISIFTGHFGSGKTEVAVSYALKLRSAGNKTTIVDLDIVNPYFRTKDAEKILSDTGVKVIAPQFANTNVDIPALPSEIFSVFESNGDFVVFDVGGDHDGAIALGRYLKYFSKEPYDMYFVVNHKRPLTENVSDSVGLLRQIEQVSRLKINGIVNNSNLMCETSVNDILQGQEFCENISRIVNVPVKIISGRPDIVDNLPNKYKGFALKLGMHIKMP